MTKRYTAGMEVDAWCTKCKLDLNHRIIAMDGETIKRVECLTCRGHHNYRRPKSAEPPKKKTATRKRSTAATRRSAAAKADEIRQAWEQAIMGKAADDFTAYRITETFAPGQLLRHKKFGDGVVAAVLEDGKVNVIFEEGEKTLVHARS